MAWSPVGWSVGGGERRFQKLGQTKESFPPAKGTETATGRYAPGRNLCVRVEACGRGPGGCDVQACTLARSRYGESMLCVAKRGHLPDQGHNL